MLERDEAHPHVGQYWNEVMDGFFVPRCTARTQAFQKLVAAYSEPHRHYHNLRHVSQVLDTLVAWEYKLKDWKAVFLAALYHDVIYDPRSSENERRSADRAVETLRELGLDDRPIDRVADLIWMTKTHQASADDTDALLFLDADLSILAMPKDTYDSYCQGIRKEYGWVPEGDFCRGRRSILASFLERPNIYRSEPLRYLEDRARANIVAEIAQIDEILRTLPS